ncbi:MAG TPA: hypothetical protein VGE52_00325, partial [Pirellulales bacterium]
VATTGDPVQNGQWRPSGDPLYDFAWRPTHGPLDVRWRIVGALDGRFTDGQRGLPLRGGSLGLAASGYLARLLAGEWTESNGVADWTGTGVIAEVGAAGRPTRFGEVDDASLSQKVRACLAPGRARRFYVASTQSGLAENFASNCAPAGAPRSPIGKADDLTTLLAAVRTDLGWDRDALSGPSVAVSAISAFITEYTSTEFNPNVLNSGPKPFGGRETQIDDFLTWLRNPHSPRRLLAAASGRGKSALLLHAVLRAMRTADLADVRIAYVPISIRFGTAAREIVVPALADRLRSALGDFSIQHTEAGVADALTRDQPAGRRLLVVLDGIDEAVGWQVTHSLIPPTLGAGVKVFVSARDAETTARDWLTQLGWPAITPAPELPPLDAAGLRDVLLSMGRPLDVHAADDEFLRVLLDLTQGDPLLVRLYVEDLWRTASGGVAINGPQALVDAANSGGVRSGLAGYFDRWWKDQERLWETRGDAAARMDRATRLSDVLSAAFGPLTAEDLAKVLAKFRPLTDERLDSRIVLRQWISDFRRFLTGDGETIGFSFSHPRLKEHFREKGTTSEKRVRHSELQEAFVAWGDEAMWGEDASLLPQPTIERRQASSRLAARVPPTNTPEPEPVQLIAEEASAYLVRHYGEHLEAAERLTDGQRLPRLARLLDDDWCEAWQYVSSRDDYGGYLADVARVARAARRLNEAARSAVPRCSPAFPHFALESRIELIRASIRTLQQKIPPNLVAL